MRLHGPGEIARRQAQQVPAFFDDVGAYVGERPDVGERELSVHSPHEVPRRPDRGTRLR